MDWIRSHSMLGDAKGVSTLRTPARAGISAISGKVEIPRTKVHAVQGGATPGRSQGEPILEEVECVPHHGCLVLDHADGDADGDA
eukprot:scaffold1739_cov242-Pinguiococcus_pyrenoidosus.AAC.4